MSAASADRRDDVLRLLSDAPEGLSDGQLAVALGDGVRSQTVNALCRRMVAEGAVERIGSRPILNRLVPAPSTRKRRAKRTAVAPRAAREQVATPPAPGDTDTRPGRTGALVPVDTTTRPPEPGPPPPDSEPAVTEPEPAVTAAPLASEASPEDPSPAVLAPEERPEDALPDPTSPPEERPEDALPDPPAPPETPVPPAAPVARPAAGPTTHGPAAHDPAAAAESAALPVRDVLQAWSRTCNVQAAVASWLHGRGATIRSVAVEGAAARDLVARLDGSELHVEVTGWPPDSDRTHPTTVAADWFAAAARAAVRRRGARPGARIVVALPDTRRYRALAAAAGPGLAGARAEVWFVDPDGSVEATTARG